VLLAGTVVRLAARCWFKPGSVTFWLLLTSLKSYAMLACFAIILLAPFFRPLVDPLKLLVPIVGAAERELAVNRFFCVLAMVYATGGQRVESMIRLASRTVANVAIRRDLLRAARSIELGASIPQAFRQTTTLRQEEQDLIAGGDLSGTLGLSFGRISSMAGESLKVRLELFTYVAVRVTMAVVVYSIAFTVLSLVMGG